MKRRWIGLIVVCFAALMVTAALIFSWRKPVPELPALHKYEHLPVGFHQALQQDRADVGRLPNDPDALRKLARLYQANRLFQEAQFCYRTIEKTATKLTARDHYYLADIALNEGDLDRAQKELRQVITDEPNTIPARVSLAEALFKSGEQELAEKEYVAILAIEANQPQASLGLARIELQRGQDDFAVARLDRLLAAHLESTSAAALLAQVLDRRGEVERAAAMTQLSRQKHEPVPLDPWLDALAVDCYDLQRLALKFEEYLMAGQIEPALPLLERVEELDPKSWIPHLLRGWIRARANLHVDAVTEYRMAVTKGGDPEKVVPLMIRSLVAAGNLTEASNTLADFYAKMPDSIPILNAYAEVAVQRGDDKLARSLLVNVLQKEPYLYTPNMSLAKILWTAGEREEAVKCLQRIVKVFPVDVASRGLLGQYFLEKSDPFSAIPPLEQAVPQAAPGTPARDRLVTMLHTAYFQAANAEQEKGRLVEAAAAFEKAAILVPTDLDALVGKANACVQLKQFRRAADALQQMATLQPENATIHLSLGDVLYQNGDREPARQEWRRAVELTTSTEIELRHALNSRLTGPITPDMFQ